MDISSGLIIKEALSLRDFFAIRKIRNECAFFMTNDQSQISLWGQIKFIVRYIIQAQYESVMYIARLDEQCIGYGYVRSDRRNSWSWISGGLLESERGNGYGEKLFKFLLDTLSGEYVYLDVLESNKRAYKLYYKLGFREFDRMEGKYGVVISMRKM